MLRIISINGERIAERDPVLLNQAVSVLIIGLASLVIVPSAEALRPYLLSENAVPVERGKSRLEVGFSTERIGKDASGYGSDASGYALVGEYAYGVINNMEFEVEMPYRFLVVEEGDDEDGLGDIKLKSKIRFIKGREANPLSIAGQLIIKFPTCNDGKGLSMECTGEPDVGLQAIASKEFFPLAVHLNLGFVFIGNPPRGDLDDVFRYGLAFDLQTRYESLRLISELAGETQRHPDIDSDLLWILGGMVYAVGIENSVDLGISAGLTDGTPDYTLTAGYSHYFN